MFSSCTLVSGNIESNRTSSVSTGDSASDSRRRPLLARLDPTVVWPVQRHAVAHDDVAPPAQVGDDKAHPAPVRPAPDSLDVPALVQSEPHVITIKVVR